MSNANSGKNELLTEIINLASLLPAENESDISQRIYEIAGSGSDEGTIGRMRQVLKEVRNQIPNYETLTLDDFGDSAEIDAVTIGRNAIDFGQQETLYRTIILPPGTIIKKDQNRQFGAQIVIQVTGGVLIYLTQNDFPKTGIRIQPRKKESLDPAQVE